MSAILIKGAAAIAVGRRKGPFYFRANYADANGLQGARRGDEAAGILVRFPAERLRVRTLPLPLVIARTNCATDEQDQQQQQRCRMTPVISTIATVAWLGSSRTGELSGVFEKAAVRANSQCPKRPIDPQQIDGSTDR